MSEERTSSRRNRSSSVCFVPGGGSLEALPPLGVGTPPSQARRPRRPAARSQSARLNNNHRSTKRRSTLTNSAEIGRAQHPSNSEPRLADDDVSPHVRRKSTNRRGTSVYQRKSTAFLDVPESKRGAHADEEDEDSYRLRSFSFTSKGVINRGDSFRRRRSRSNSLCPPASGGGIGTGGGGGGGGTPSPIRDEPDQTIPVTKYIVALLGTQGVGKTALISQFMTSEYINAYDRQKDILGSQTVSIMLNGEEYELAFLNLSSTKEIDKSRPPDAFVILYSVVDKASFLKAEAEITKLQDADLLRSRPVIIAGNKIDLARSRAVSTQDGKCLACTFRAKFIEISVGINHNVDELLVGILTQIRLKALSYEDRDNQSQWYKSRGMVKASMKARQMFTWLFGKEDSKFKNCENLQIL